MMPIAIPRSLPRSLFRSLCKYGRPPGFARIAALRPRLRQSTSPRNRTFFRIAYPRIAGSRDVAPSRVTSRISPSIANATRSFARATETIARPAPLRRREALPPELHPREEHEDEDPELGDDREGRPRLARRARVDQAQEGRPEDDPRKDLPDHRGRARPLKRPAREPPRG